MLERNEEPTHIVKHESQSYNFLNALFGRKQYYSFVAQRSLEECISLIQKRQTGKAKTTSTFFGVSFPNEQVDISIEYPMPNTASFIMLMEMPSRSGAHRARFSGRFEYLTDESTAVHGEVVEDTSYMLYSLLGFSLVGLIFLLKGIVEHAVVGGLAVFFGLLTVGGLGLFIDYLWTKRSHRHYMELLMTRPQPVHVPNDTKSV